MWSLVASVCPLIAQFVMLAVAVMQRNWMFMAMIVPGVVMTATYALSSAARMKQERAVQNARRHNGTAPTSKAANEAEKLDISPLPATNFTSMVLKAEPEYTIEGLWRLVVRKWADRRPTLNTAVGVARGETGGEKPFHLDILAQGPHALVAGTTGSGKSVFLQSWCISMALLASPAQLNFIFLDFKGGSTFRVLHHLPHVVGFVSDLNLAHAVRALRAIEAELNRREELVAAAGVGTVDDLKQPPARIIIVVDEFHALRYALPDYTEHLVRIASQGRSLGMNLILATQNPMGQVSADMKSNINLNICLRVRDRMQSSEMVGSGIAANLPPAASGMAIISDSESTDVFRSSRPANLKTIVAQCKRAARFCELPAPTPLFTPPLPARLDEGPSVHGQLSLSHVLIGVSDDGVLTHLCALNLTTGNIAIVGPTGTGKTTLAHSILRKLTHIAKHHTTDQHPDAVAHDAGNLSIRWTMYTDHGFLDTFVTKAHREEELAWIVDGADDLLDPLSTHPLHEPFMKALALKTTHVVFTLNSTKFLRYPEHCSTRVIFPTADRTVDAMAGIPATLLAEWNQRDYETAGRAVLLSGSVARNIQCFRQIF